MTYPEFDGEWRCNGCKIKYSNNVFYHWHCSQCRIDLCQDCMHATAEVSNTGTGISIDFVKCLKDIEGTDFGNGG